MTNKCQTLIAVGVAILSSSCTTTHWSNTTDDIDLLETAYRQLIEQFKPIDAVYLSTGFDHQRRMYDDPPFAVFVRLSDIPVRLRPGSEIGFTDAGVKVKETGRDAIVFVVHIKKRAHDGILLECGHYKNMLNASGNEYKATRSGGKWVLTPTGNLWLSERKPNQQIQAIAAGRGSA